MTVPAWVTDGYMHAARGAVRRELSCDLPGGPAREGAIEDEAEELADVLAGAAEHWLEDRQRELRRAA